MTAPSDLPIRVITPHSGVEGFRNAISSLSKGFPAARGLALRLFLRDTRAEYRQSLLGYLWLVAPVVANTLTWVFLNSQGVIRVDSGPVPYPIFVLSGVVLWTAFNGGVMAMLTVINLARGILAKVNFPHEALVYSALMRAAVDAALATVLIIPALLLLGAELRSTMLLYPVALAGSLMLGACIGLLLLPVAALYGDISRAIQLLLRFGFFFTPVIYALPADGIARMVMMVNPATPVITTGRAWLTGSPEAMTTSFIIVMGGVALAFIAGLLIYKVALPHLIERLGG